MLLSHADRSSPHLEPLTEVVAISRMLEGIGTLPATRRLIDIYVRFGEFLRADTQLALTRLNDRATAALVEATRHPAPRIAAWAEQRLKRLGRSAPSDALQTLDPQIRADILRAYGAIGRLDTARLLISYAASENAEVRLAGRQAVTMLGAAALWQLRDAYEKTLGTRAPHEWPWDRVARELFGQFERQRLTDLYRLFNRGRAAQAGGDLAAARHAFDQVLTRDPKFAHADTLAAFYFRFAQDRADSDPEAALKALARAERLQPDGPLHPRTLSLRYTLEAEQLLKQHVVDEVLLLRARELDETNERAALLLARWATTQTPAQATWNRYLAACIIAAVSALGLMVVLYRQRRDRLKANTASPEL
jgi:tetratricopeptide (TPR) repeat protein